MRIISVVPIKLNNERLPGKNIKPLGGKPLIEYIQRMLLQVDEINERYIYCSDETICKYLLPGINFLKRSPELDLQTSNFTKIFEHFLSDVDADIYVYAHATAPFISAETTKKCIEAVVSGSYDSAFCASVIQDYLWQDGKPLNFNASNLPRSQDLKPIYRETSGVYVFTKEVFTKYRRRVGKNPFIRELSYKEAIDINLPEDFEMAELLSTALVE